MELITPIVAVSDRVFWGWFFELHSARLYADGVPQSLTHIEIDAWKRLNNIQLKPHHVKLIREMDGSFMNSYLKIQKERQSYQAQG